MESFSHWGMHGGALAEPMQCHGQPVYGDVMWWVTDDRPSPSDKFNNTLNFMTPIQYVNPVNYYDDFTVYHG